MNTTPRTRAHIAIRIASRFSLRLLRVRRLVRDRCARAAPCEHPARALCTSARPRRAPVPRCLPEHTSLVPQPTRHARPRVRSGRRHRRPKRRRFAPRVNNVRCFKECGSGRDRRAAKPPPSMRYLPRTQPHLAGRQPAPEAAADSPRARRMCACAAAREHLQPLTTDLGAREPWTGGVACPALAQRRWSHNLLHQLQCATRAASRPRHCRAVRGPASQRVCTGCRSVQRAPGAAVPPLSAPDRDVPTAGTTAKRRHPAAHSHHV